MPGSSVSSSGAWAVPHQRGSSIGKVSPLRGSRYACPRPRGDRQPQLRLQRRGRRTGGSRAGWLRDRAAGLCRSCRRRQALPCGASRRGGRYRFLRPYGHGARHRLGGGPVVGADRRRHPARAGQHGYEGPGRSHHRRRPGIAGLDARYAADHHGRGNHQAGRALDCRALHARAARAAARHRGGGADEHDRIRACRMPTTIRRSPTSI